MQAFIDGVTLAIVALALALLFIRLYLVKMSRDRYLKDIMTFRTPSSSLSRYYNWRVTNFENAFGEGMIFIFILVCLTYGVGFMMFNLEQITNASWILILVILLSLVSAIQNAWRVKEVVDSQDRITTAIKSAKDKIGVTRLMVDDLYLQGAMGDGRTWFALFKLAQRQDRVGWAIRDVLIEKGREEESRFQRQPTEPIKDDSSSGPGIDS